MVYDFLEMWSFLVEFVRDEKEEVTEPSLVFSYGKRPATAPELHYSDGAEGGLSEEDDLDDDDELGFDEEDLADGYSSSEDW